MEGYMYLKFFNIGCLILWTSFGLSLSKSIERLLKLDDTDDIRWVADAVNYDYDYSNDGPQGIQLIEDDICGVLPDIVLSGRACKSTVCTRHTDCRGKNQRCCHNGCVKTCMPQLDPPPIIDWIKEPKRRVISGVSWLIGGPSSNNGLESCTTTRFGKNEDPLLCPHGYICHVIKRGNRKKGIPNRGQCVPEKDNAVVKKSLSRNKSSNAECFLDKYVLANGASMVFNERDYISMVLVENKRLQRKLSKEIYDALDLCF